MNIILERRIAMNLTQGEVAAPLYRTKQWLSLIERERLIPDQDTKKKILEVIERLGKFKARASVAERRMLADLTLRSPRAFRSRRSTPDAASACI